MNKNNFIPAGMEDDDDDFNPGDPDFHWDLEDLNFRGAVMEFEQLLNMDYDAAGDADDALDEFDDFFSDYEDEFGIGYFSDGEDQFDVEDATVYTNLQDAIAVLPKISYQNGTRPLVRMLPRPVAETYESLFRVLEELELMLKTWKRRMQHPFTAHICGRDVEPLTVDFSGTDVESDDQEAAACGRAAAAAAAASSNEASKTAKPPKVNESLTKKKYCQSARLFHTVFDGGEPEMDQLIGFVKKMRKFVQGVIFSLFMEHFGEEESLMSRLPAELREKIWKLTQEGDDVHHVGLRSADAAHSAVETERITELFGAVGNVHIIVFEILFSQQLILKTPTILLLENEERKKSSYAKRFFHRHLKSLRVAFHRFRALDRLFSGGGEAAKTTVVDDPATRLERGMYSVQMNRTFRPNGDLLKHDAGGRRNRAKQRLDRSWHVAPLGASDHRNRLFASVFGSEDGRSGGNAVVRVRFRDLLRDEIVATVATELPLLDMFSGGNGSIVVHTAMSLHENLFAILHRVLDGDLLRVVQWRIPDQRTRRRRVELTMRDAATFDLKSSTASEVALRTTRIDGGTVHLVAETSRVTILDAGDGRVLDKIIFEDGEPIAVLSLRLNMMLLEKKSRSIALYDLDTRREVESFAFAEMCAGRGCCAGCGCRYGAKFDLNADRFVVCVASMSHFQVHGYEGAKAWKVGGGGSVDVAHLERWIFSDGVVYACSTFPPPANIDCTVMRLFALNLEAGGAVCPIVSVTTESLNPYQALNDCHRYLSLVTPVNEVPGRLMVFQFAGEGVLALGLGGDTYLTVKFHDGEAEALEEEAAALARRRHFYESWDDVEKRLKTKHAKQKESDAERVALVGKVREKFLGRTGDEHRLRGKVHSWKPDRSYGFVRPVGEAKDLGNLFLHLSEIANRERLRGRKPRNAQWVEFHAADDAGKSNFRAVNVTLIDNPNRKTEEEEEKEEEGVAARAKTKRGRRRRVRSKNSKSE